MKQKKSNFTCYLDKANQLLHWLRSIKVVVLLLESNKEIVGSDISKISLIQVLYLKVLQNQRYYCYLGPEIEWPFRGFVISFDFLWSSVRVSHDARCKMYKAPSSFRL